MTEEEQKQGFYELQKYKMQNSQLIVQKTRLEDDLKKTKNQMELIKESYQDLQEELYKRKHSTQNEIEEQEESNDKNLESIERISELELKVNKLLDEKIKLEQQLSQYSDYEIFKKKLEKFTIDKESAETERDIYKQKFSKQEE